MRIFPMIPILVGNVLAVTAAAGQPADDRPPPIYRPSIAEDGKAPSDPVQSDATPDTLRRALALAYDSNPDLLAQRTRLRGTDYRVPAARAAYGPRLDFETRGSFQRDRSQLAPQLFTTNRGLTSTTALIFSQPLYTFGRNRSAEKVALAEVALGREQLRLVETNVLQTVIVAYASLRRAVLGVEIARENLALLDRQYAENSERFKYREITIADLQQVETRRELGRGQLLQVQGQLGLSRSQFLRAVGASAPDTLAAPAPLPGLPGTLDQAYTIADRDSPILRAAHAREKVSRATTDTIRAEMGPRIDLNGSASRGPVSPFNDDFRTTSLRGEVTLQMPLIDSGLRRARLAEASESNQADWRLIDGALRETRQGIAAAWDQAAAAAASVEFYRRAVAAAQKAYDGAVLQQKAGFRTTLDVLDLARDLLTVRNNLVTAEADVYIAQAAILGAIGRLNASTLLPDVAPYDPDRHFDRVRHSNDLPLLTPVLSRIDGVTTRENTTDRPIRDPSGMLREPGAVPARPVQPTVPR